MSNENYDRPKQRHTDRRLETARQLGSILLWIGVILLSVGGYTSASMLRFEQEAFAQATAMALLSGQPSPEPTRFESIPSLANTPTLAPSVSLIQDEGPSMLVITSTQVTFIPSDPGSDQVENPYGALQDRLVPQPTATPTPEPRVLLPPDRIVINSIGLDSPIVPVGWHAWEQDGTNHPVWDVADYAVGWHNTSAYPDDGGNTVLSGHNNIRGKVFRDLIEVEIGERILVYTGQQVHFYQVVEKHLLLDQNQPVTVRLENAKWIGPTLDKRLTLVTCWPYTGNSHRLIVVAIPISSIDAGQLEE